jgi:hypothetical protein
MAWMITKDCITKKGDEGYAFGRGQWGEEGADSERPSTGALPFPFRLLDDDMEIHYTGRYDAAALDDDEAWGGLYTAERWGTWFSGACHVQVKLDDYIKLVYGDNGVPGHMVDFFEKERAKSKDGWYIPYG